MNMNEPKLRFKADDGSQFPDWEKKPFGDVVSEFKVKTKVEDEDTLLSCAINGVFLNSELFGHQRGQSNVGYLKIKKGTLILSAQNLHLGNANVNMRFEHGMISPAYKTYNIVGCCVEYMNQWVKRDITKQFFYNATTVGASGCRRNVDWEMLYSQLFAVPSLPEQQKIAEFLSTIDTVIEKQKETVSAWEERKKGVMQKLFSQEVRFKADDGSDFPDWEEKSFLDVFENLNNSTFSRDCLNYGAGNVKYIHYGDILTKFGFAIDVQSSNVPYVNEDLDCEKYASLSDGDIVIADTAEDDTVGRAVEIMNAHCGKTISGLHTIACHPREKFASKYLGYFMNADIYHNQLRPYMQGIKVTSVSKTNIALTKILVPCLAEQQKIADCLSSLDEVIEKQKETLAAWEELKKGLLQQMFV